MHTVNNDKNGSELWPKIFCYRFHKTFWCSQAGNIPGCDGNQFRIRLPWVSWRTVSQVNVLFAVWPECHPKAFKSRLREDVRKGDTARYVWKKIWHRGQKVVVFLQGELILHLALLWSVSCHKKDHKDWKQEDKEDSVYIRARIPQVLCELTFQNVERESVSRAWSFSALHLMVTWVPGFSFVFQHTKMVSEAQLHSVRRLGRWSVWRKRANRANLRFKRKRFSLAHN